MAIDPAVPRTRRALLGAALGGLAAAIATAVGRPAEVSAAAGDPLIIGQANAGGSSSTRLKGSSTAAVLKLTQNGNGVGVRGESVGGTGGVFTTQQADQYGVRASNTGTEGVGAAIQADGGNNYAVHATIDNGNGTVLLAQNLGQSGSGYGIKGVVATTDTAFGDAAGVYGLASGLGAGVGTLGFANGSGAGVFGYSNDGPGIYGDSGGGGWAGRFNGRISVKDNAPYIVIGEYAAGVNSDPANAGSDTLRLFAKDNGSGKVQLCVRFPSGDAIVLATEA